MPDINGQPAGPQGASPTMSGEPVSPTPDATPGTGPAAAVDGSAHRRAWLLPLVTGAAGLVIGVLLGVSISATVITAQQEAADEAAADAAEAAKSELFADAARRCGLTNVVEIVDNGKTMIVDGEGEDSGTGDVSFTDLDCIISAVGTPESVRELMYSTRSLDGRQSGEWGDVSASWGYHPDDGLDIIFVIAD